MTIISADIENLGCGMKVILFIEIFIGFFLCAAKVLASETCQQLASEYMARQSALPSPSFGIEVEGLIPRKRSREYYSNILLAALPMDIENLEILIKERKSPFFKVREESVFVSYWQNGEKKNWIISHDPTIYTFNNRSIELISPILKSEEDLAFFKSILRLFGEHGMREARYSGGTHVHVDFASPLAAEVKILKLAFSQFEEELLSRIGIPRGRRNWILPTENKVVELLEKNDFYQGYNLFELIDEIAPSRFRAMNLRAIEKHGTVEFRLFPSSLNLKEIDFMVAFSTEFVQRIRSQELELMNYLKRTDLGKFRVDDLLILLKLNGHRGKSVFRNFENHLRRKKKIVRKIYFYGLLLWASSIGDAGFGQH